MAGSTLLEGGIVHAVRPNACSKETSPLLPPRLKPTRGRRRRVEGLDVVASLSSSACGTGPRYREIGPGGAPAALAGSGGAVALCSLTTILGYAALLMADNRAIFSFGLTAVLGEITCLSAALVALPAVLIARDRRRTVAEEPVPAGA